MSSPCAPYQDMPQSFHAPYQDLPPSFYKRRKTPRYEVRRYDHGHPSHVLGDKVWVVRYTNKRWYAVALFKFWARPKGSMLIDTKTGEILASR